MWKFEVFSSDFNLETKQERAWRSKNKARNSEMMKELHPVQTHPCEFRKDILEKVEELSAVYGNETPISDVDGLFSSMGRDLWRWEGLVWRLVYRELTTILKSCFLPKDSTYPPLLRMKHWMSRKSGKRKR